MGRLFFPPYKKRFERIYLQREVDGPPQRDHIGFRLIDDGRRQLLFFVDFFIRVRIGIRTGVAGSGGISIGFA